MLESFNPLNKAEMMMHPRDFVESYIDAWNQRDARHIAGHLTPDGVYYDIPSQSRYCRQELIGYLKDFFDHNDERYELDGEIASSENSIAFQYKVVGGVDSLCGAEFVRLNGDHAIQIDDFYQMNGALQDTSNAQKYAKSGLSPTLLVEYKQRLTNLMENERSWLDSSLTLPKLSRLVQCPVNHLSQVINAGFGMSFFDYLNTYRIEEAKQILMSQENPGPPILTVAFEVGFNSNSAFYAAFKRACGQTPAQYRRSHWRQHERQAETERT